MSSLIVETHASTSAYHVHDKDTDVKTSIDQVDLDVADAQGSSENHYDDNGWSRGLSARSMIMLALGGGIGTGLWVGTGTALASAGPGSCAIAYTLVALTIFFEFQAVGEMTALKPIHGGWFRQNMEYVDKALAFAAGMNFWFEWVMIIPAEIVAAISVLHYWPAAANFPMAGYISIFLVAGALPNLLPVKSYGYVEWVMSFVKVVAIVGSMCFMFIYTSGGVPNTDGPIVFRYWRNPGAFNNGAKGFCKALLQAAFSVASASYIALCAGEMKDPRRTVKRAIKPLFGRTFAFFVVNIWLVGMCVPWNDPDLNNASGTLASPFIIAVKRAGVPVLPNILNALVFITVASCAITSYYLASRALTSMSELHIIHPLFGRKDEKGRPWFALIASGILGGGLTYLNCNDTSEVVYAWFSNLVGSATFLDWLFVFIPNIRFHKGLKAQNITNLPFRSRFGIYGSYAGVVLSLFFLIVELYYAISPISTKPSAEQFFSAYITVPLFAMDYFLYKWWYKTKIVKPEEMDFGAAKYFDEQDKKQTEKEAKDPKLPRPLYQKILKALLG